MSAVGVDTSVLVRVAKPSDARHGQAVRTLARLRADGDRLILVPQALAEFWVVATRLVEVNSLGASPRPPTRRSRAASASSSPSPSLPAPSR